MYRVLVADQLGQEGLDMLEKADTIACEVETGLTEEELVARIGEIEGLIVRSGTQVTSRLLDAARSLRVVGRAGMGVDNIDVAAATERGVIVLNTPQANSVATAEQTFALMLSASRHTVDAHTSVGSGKWERGRYAGTELNHKTLGILGFGRIGRLVAARAQAFGMDVLAYDPYVSEEVGREHQVTLVNVDQVFSGSDYITLHLPSSPETSNIINAAAIAAMKDGVIIINAARGELVDEQALAEGLRSGKVRAAGIDVYQAEPPGESPLIGLPNVVHTPHLGASTVEAQRDVASQIAEQVIDALSGTDIRNAVNLPFDAGPDFQDAMPYLALAERMGALQSALATGPIRSVELEVNGDVVERLARPIAAGLLAGLLREHVDVVNYVSAPVIAAQQGLTISQAK
ncbi:MAG: phosphoglycerate dehydrogenase, partial [Acidimicrobiia bacterium]|nr:phosphoglycerate dehydrogenase [Acidimicrobiia bacterium]